MLFLLDCNLFDSILTLLFTFTLKLDAKQLCTEDVKGGAKLSNPIAHHAAAISSTQPITESMTIYLILTSSPISPRVELIIPVTCTATEMQNAAVEATTVENACLIFAEE